jgi:Spy/CpxP family protein refolding chaperone
MNSRGNVKLQVWGLIVLVFVLGGVAGASLDRILFRSNTGRSGAGRPGGPRGGMDAMIKDLNLTDDQAKTIRAIFEERRKAFDLGDCPGFKEAREKTRNLIREALTPEQQKRFDEKNVE